MGERLHSINDRICKLENFQLSMEEWVILIMPLKKADRANSNDKFCSSDFLLDNINELMDRAIRVALESFRDEFTVS